MTHFGFAADIVAKYTNTNASFLAPALSIQTGTLFMQPRSCISHCYMYACGIRTTMSVPVHGQMPSDALTNGDFEADALDTGEPYRVMVPSGWNLAQEETGTRKGTSVAADRTM